MLPISEKNAHQVILPVIIIVMLGVMVLGSSFACASKNPDPVLLLQEIETKGAEYVYSNELTGLEWLAFLKRVETGEKTWLKVANAIYPATDGGPAEDLTMAVGEALVHSPHDVLLIAAPGIGVEGICDYSEMTMGFKNRDTRQQVLADIDARINAVRGLVDSDVASLQSKCIAILENAKREMLGPYGPFPDNEK